MIWTRGQDDWPADGALLVQLVPPSWTVLHVPCVALQPIVPAAGWDAVAGARFMVFTSAHAVAFALAQPALAQAAARVDRIFTHGQATAQALRARGLATEEVATARTAAELGAWLAATLPAGAAVLVPGPKVPAYDLAGALRQAGMAAVAWVCYETQAWARAAAARPAAAGDGLPLGAAFSAAEVQAATASWHGAICFASPSAVAGFAAVFRPTTNRLRQSLIAYAIGPTTAQAAGAAFADVRVAPSNSLEALLRSVIAETGGQ